MPDPLKTTRASAAKPKKVTESASQESALLQELLEKVAAYNPSFDRGQLIHAYEVAEAQHATQLRASGEPYVNHPLGTAIICAELRLDTPTLVAALLHDVVEDTGMSIEVVREEFGEEVALLVDGVTKLSLLAFTTAEEEQAENIRKMVIAMAKDIRVILIKLADRLHNMRTLSYLGKEKQINKAKETLEIYAPLAHRLGIESIRWELEDLSFATLHPRKFAEIQRMVAQRRADREKDMEEAKDILLAELGGVSIEANIVGRAKHFYSIYDKMVRKGKEFNEIFDLIALRVLVESVKDCYATLGVIHALWKPLPGRFKDYIAMPKFNMYQSLHTTVIGPKGKPLEIQIRTREMNETAQYGIAAHWMYKEKGATSGKAPNAKSERLQWLRRIMDWQSETKDAGEFMESLNMDLLRDEVYVFTPKGEVKTLPAGSTPVDFAYAVHTDVGHHCIGAKVDNRMVPLTYKLQSGDIVEVLTSKASPGPSRDWLQTVQSSGARNKIRQWFKRERREDAEHLGKEALLEAFRKQGLPAQRLMSSDLLVSVMKETNHMKKEDFFVALGTGALSAQHVVTRVIHGLNEESAAATATLPVGETAGKTADTTSGMSSSELGIQVGGVGDVAVRIPHCCRPVPGDDVVGYISLGRGITIHRRDCPNLRSLEKNPERLVSVTWDPQGKMPLRVEIQIEAYDRDRLLEDISRTLSESGVSIIGAQITTARDNMVKDRFVFEVPNIDYLETVLQRIRRIDTVYDAYRVTPN